MVPVDLKTTASKVILSGVLVKDNCTSELFQDLTYPSSVVQVNGGTKDLTFQVFRTRIFNNLDPNDIKAIIVD